MTKLGGANFAPSWQPDGKRLIFASNIADPKGRNFDIYLVNVDGTGLEHVTFNDTFDGFPMFSPDGKKVVFASNRNAKAEGETQRLHRGLGRVGLAARFPLLAVANPPLKLTFATASRRPRAAAPRR